MYDAALVPERVAAEALGASAYIAWFWLCVLVTSVSRLAKRTVATRETRTNNQI